MTKSLTGKVALVTGVTSPHRYGPACMRVFRFVRP